MPFRNSATVEIVNGVIVVDKPAGMTSHDVVNRVRRITGNRKIGHLGTLDPLATGVLPLVVGRATRLAQFFTTSDKKYDARIRFGYSTDTYDREGVSTSEPVEPIFTREDLEAALGHFRGTFMQTPPPVSAKKVGGQPAYKLARKQIAVELKPVEVTVFALDLVGFGEGCARVLAHCSAGTYVRAIAHELGTRLGCGAFVDELRRTASGDFTEEQSHTLEALARLAESGAWSDAVIPAARLLPQFPSAFVDATTAGNIRQGKDFRVSPFRAQPSAKYVKAVGADGELVAIGEARLPHLYHPVLVL
jgi:tRNA pseudouridine55 synthase